LWTASASITRTVSSSCNCWCLGDDLAVEIWVAET